MQGIWRGELNIVFACIGAASVARQLSALRLESCSHLGAALTLFTGLLSEQTRGLVATCRA